jgi:hypothetical protein
VEESPSLYSNKLKELKSLSDDMFTRQKEMIERPKTIAKARAVLYKAKSDLKTVGVAASARHCDCD